MGVVRLARIACAQLAYAARGRSDVKRRTERGGEELAEETVGPQAFELRLYRAAPPSKQRRCGEVDPPEEGMIRRVRLPTAPPPSTHPTPNPPGVGRPFKGGGEHLSSCEPLHF